MSSQKLSKLINELVTEAMNRPKVINECIDVTESPAGGWELKLVTRGRDGGNSTNGFGFSEKTGGTHFDVGSSVIKGLKFKAVVQAHVNFLSSEEPSRMPPFKPSKALEALKHGTATTATGAVITATPGLQSLVAQFLAPKAARLVTTKVDVVTAPESSSQLANLFGNELARLIGAKFIPSGMLKATDKAEAVDPLPSKLVADAKAIKAFLRALERFQAAPNSSLKHSFHTSQRDLVTKWLRPSNEFTDAVTAIEGEKGPAPNGIKVLMVDDVITTGSSFSEAAATLNRLGGYQLVDAIAMFKMQDSK